VTDRAAERIICQLAAPVRLLQPSQPREPIAQPSLRLNRRPLRSGILLSEQLAQRDGTKRISCRDSGQKRETAHLCSMRKKLCSSEFPTARPGARPIWRRVMA